MKLKEKPLLVTGVFLKEDIQSHNSIKNYNFLILFCQYIDKLTP